MTNNEAIKLITLSHDKNCFLWSVSISICAGRAGSMICYLPDSFGARGEDWFSRVSAAPADKFRSKTGNNLIRYFQGTWHLIFLTPHYLTEGSRFLTISLFLLLLTAAGMAIGATAVMLLAAVGFERRLGRMHSEPADGYRRIGVYDRSDRLAAAPDGHSVPGICFSPFSERAVQVKPSCVDVNGGRS
jgi:hypothetical protein